MAAMAASIAETVAGMQQVVCQDEYESDSDEAYLQLSNYNNKLKRKFGDFSGGIEDRASGPRRHRKTVKHAGHLREILRKNPKRCNENGDEIATEDEDEAADVRAAEENPYAGIKLEHLLAPLTSAAALAQHPSLSEAYNSTALSSMAQHANFALQRERRSLAHAKKMLVELRGDGSWIPAGRLRDPNDEMIFDTTKLYETILENAPIKKHVNHHQRSNQASASAGSLTMTDGNIATRETGLLEEQPDTLDVNSSARGSIAARGRSREPHDKAVVLEKTAESHEEAAVPHKPSGHTADDSVLTSVENEPDGANSVVKETPLVETQGQDEETQTPPRRVTRAQAQADRSSATPETAPHEAWHSPQLHPLFLIPPSARPDQDLGLPPIEAQDTRHLLSMYVQKQEEVCRGAQRLYEGLLQAERQKHTVYKWCKAEAHVGEMSDGEDWYDKEEWGLEEDLRKGQIEEEEDTVVQGKKTRRGRGVHFLAGLSTGLLTATILQPVDLLKTRLQQPQRALILPSLRSIFHGPNAQGIRGLWRGTVPSVIRTGVGSALYFTLLNAMRSNALFVGPKARDMKSIGHAQPQLSSSNLPQLSTKANLVAGAAARATAGFLLMPLTIVKVRYESTLYSYRSLAGACRDIWKGEGLRGFFKAAGATAIRDAPYAGLYVVVYEEGKTKLNAWSSTSGTRMTSTRAGLINFSAGVFAASVATAVTNPFDAIKTRLQLLPGAYGNMVGAAKKMVLEDGWKSFMDGFGLRVGRKAASSALSWTLYEELIRRAEANFGDRV